jgi:hypothetical protein
VAALHDRLKLLQRQQVVWGAVTVIFVVLIIAAAQVFMASINEDITAVAAFANRVTRTSHFQWICFFAEPGIFFMCFYLTLFVKGIRPLPGAAAAVAFQRDTALESAGPSFLKFAFLPSLYLTLASLPILPLIAEGHPQTPQSHQF